MTSVSESLNDVTEECITKAIKVRINRYKIENNLNTSAEKIILFRYQSIVDGEKNELCLVEDYLKQAHIYENVDGVTYHESKKTLTDISATEIVHGEHNKMINFIKKSVEKIIFNYNLDITD